MSLGTILIITGLVALALTAVFKFFFSDQIKNLGMSFIQNFVGALFIFSGWVKAVDPMGTAFKMEQYFAEFEATFNGTWLSFISPLFPALSKASIGFSVGMIVFEIILGIMLILGARLKFTNKAFFILVGFFTVLTGFTYLTGYVPSDVNFFDFSNWTAFKETNMKVTDCGCFGDFVKLKPKVSFLKDVFLLIPAFLFLFKRESMHEIWGAKTRDIIYLAATPIVLLYCFSNYIWDIPHLDFRPFNIGKDVKTQKQIEQDAAASVQVVAYKLENRNSGEVVELQTSEYLKKYQDFPKSDWSTEQITSKPSIEPSKISDFEFQDLDGNEATSRLLEDPNYQLLVVSYQLPYETEKVKRLVKDSIFTTDTLLVEDTPSPQLVKRLVDVVDKEQTSIKYIYSPKYLSRYEEIAAPFIKEAQASGVRVSQVVGMTDPEMLKAFEKEIGCDMDQYMADDILLKTIVRSNPGFVLWKDGKIVFKWHMDKLPSFKEVEAEFLK